MDFTPLVQQAASLLIPVLPYLIDAGHGVAKKVGEATVETATEAARSLWNWLRSNAETHRPELLEAAQDVAKESNNTDAHAAFRQQLRKMLDAQPSLQEELRKLVQAAESSGNQVTASGAGAVAVGGGVSGSTITTNVNKAQ